MLDIEIDKKRIITNVRIIPRTINGADYFFRTPKQKNRGKNEGGRTLNNQQILII